jgi:succinyl-diaminopimelate desuccinylase
MDASRICADLVKIKSENPPGDTTDAIEYTRAVLAGLGIRSVITQNDGGRCNLVTSGTPKRLLLCGHLDVVPAMNESWTLPPFSGTIKDGYIWGRGATDMKGGCTAILCASAALVEKERDLPATLAFVCDEETGGERGIRYLLAKKMITPCDCLIAEPTPARHPCIGQKGLCRLVMKFTGTPGHGSLYPALGVSAVMEAAALLAYIKSLSAKEYPVDESLKGVIARSSGVFAEEFKIRGGSEILQRLMFNPGVIHGGEKANIVAQHCDLDLEMRVPWGCSIPELVLDIRAHAPHGTIISETVNEPSLTAPGCTLVSIACKAVENVYGGNVFPIVQWAASDARHLRLAGFNVIEYGPGELSTLHAVNERIAIASIEKAAGIYAEIMREYARLG